MIAQMTVKLNANGIGSIQLDNRDISGAIQGMEIRTRAGKFTEASLHLLAVQLEAEVDAKLYLSDETRELLIRYGWTPPPETNEEELS